MQFIRNLWKHHVNADHVNAIKLHKINVIINYWEQLT